MASVVVVKAFQGTVETVELHPSEDSGWGSLGEYVGAPPETSLDEWLKAWVSTDPPGWYNHDHYGDCRILADRGTTGEAHGVRLFKHKGLGRSG